MTIVYSHNNKFLEAPTIWESLSCGDLSGKAGYKFHVHVRRFALADLPEGDAESAKWLETRWIEKGEYWRRREKNGRNLEFYRVGTNVMVHASCMCLANRVHRASDTVAAMFELERISHSRIAVSLFGLRILLFMLRSEIGHVLSISRTKTPNQLNPSRIPEST
jgi:hypothetical protein